MLYQAGLQSWFGKIDALKDPAILYSVLVIVLLVVAYLFSAIKATLLEWLEGKSGILRLAAPWLYWHQQSRLVKHGIRYFGLLAPPLKRADIGSRICALRQQKRPCPRRLGWAFLLKRDFGKDPTIDRLGQPMRWAGRLKPRL